jgi:hypothetical protein
MLYVYLPVSPRSSNTWVRYRVTLGSESKRSLWMKTIVRGASG